MSVRRFWIVCGFALILSACALPGRGTGVDGSTDGDDASWVDGDTEPHDDADLDAGPPDDGCLALSDQALCASHGQECGPLWVVDSCGLLRDISDCGACPDGRCVTESCVPWTYTWMTGSWSACSVSCGGGTQTRPVWCEREDGMTVVDSLCSGTKPATSQGCNTQSCCTPSCVSHDACGGDGCGGSCGSSCASDRFCWGSYCVWDHGNNGSETCNTICAWGTSSCVGTSSYSCSTLGIGNIDCYCW